MSFEIVLYLLFLWKSEPLLFNAKWVSNRWDISWREQVTFDEVVMMTSALY